MLILFFLDTVPFFSPLPCLSLFYLPPLCPSELLSSFSLPFPRSSFLNLLSHSTSLPSFCFFDMFPSSLSLLCIFTFFSSSDSVLWSLPLQTHQYSFHLSSSKMSSGMGSISTRSDTCLRTTRGHTHSRMKNDSLTTLVHFTLLAWEVMSLRWIPQNKSYKFGRYPPQGHLLPRVRALSKGAAP